MSAEIWFAREPQTCEVWVAYFRSILGGISRWGSVWSSREHLENAEKKPGEAELDGMNSLSMLTLEADETLVFKDVFCNHFKDTCVCKVAAMFHPKTGS